MRLLIALLLVVHVGGCTEESVLITPAPDPAATEGTTGASMYRYHCAGCHGIDGNPLIDGPDDLRDYKESFQTFDSILNDGSGIMPRFSHLALEKRQSIYDHTVTLRR